MSKTTPQQSYEAKRASKRFLIQLQRTCRATVFHKWFSKSAEFIVNSKYSHILIRLIITAFLGLIILPLAVHIISTF